MSLLRFLGMGCIAAVSVALGFAACSEPEQATDCVPGTELFCRCQGSGDPGTRQCLDDGVTRGECMVAPETPCGDRVECQEGETVFCVCPDGTAGEKECLRDGTSFGDCLVDGVPCPDETDGPATTTGPGGGQGQGGSGGGSSGSCSHDLCESGDPLDAGCSTCAGSVCDADPYCCDTAWDGTCLGEVDQYCDNLCSGGPVACEHDLCTTGAALTAECDPCVTQICDDIANGNDICCTSTWDMYCVQAAQNSTDYPACSAACGCVHDECVTGVKLDAGCSACATSVCGGDPFCCNNSWDSTCVSHAENDAACDYCL